MNKITILIFIFINLCFAQIGEWDTTGNVFALVPKAESDFRTSDANTGYANLFNGSGVDSISGTLINMATGYGYVYNSGDAYYNFDGVNDIINTNYALSITDSLKFTVSFWIYFNTVSVAKGIAGFVTDASNYFVFQQTSSNAIEVRYRFAGNPIANVTSSTSLINDSTWYHISFSIDSTNCNIHLNGDSVANGTIDYTGAPIVSTYFGIGSYLFSGTYYGINGKISNFNIYNTALSTGDVNSLYLLGDTLGGVTATDNGDGTMELLAPIVSTVNLVEKKYFRFAKTFMSWSRRLLRLQ